MPDTLASSAAVCVSVDFCEHQIVAFEAQRIAAKLERDVVVAAERHAAERVDLMMAEIRTELEAAGGDDIGRHGDDGGARVDRAFGGFHRDAASGVDHCCRCRQVNIEALAERGDQRAESLLAEGRSIALADVAKSNDDTCGKSLAQV